MALVIDNGHLLYDENDDRCKVFVKQSQGMLFGFGIFIDKGCPSETKKYWGKWDWNSQEKSLLSIMESGGKWDGWEVNNVN